MKASAKRERKTAGAVLSELAMKSPMAAPSLDGTREAGLGFRAFASRGGVVTGAIVEALRDKGLLALLEIKVLVALLYTDDVSHDRATAWLFSDPDRRWASSTRSAL